MVTDGSGFVTGLSLHQMRHDKQQLEQQNDQLRSRVKKLEEKLNGVTYVCVCVYVNYAPSGFTVIQDFKLWDEGMQTDHARV